MKKYDHRTLLTIHSWLGEPGTNQWEVRGRIAALIEDDRCADLNSIIEIKEKELEKKVKAIAKDMENKNKEIEELQNMIISLYKELAILKQLETK